MIRNININKLLLSDLFFEAPVDSVNDLMTRCMDRRNTILTGSRGCGKSITLLQREKKYAGSEMPCIYTRFDACGMFGQKDDDVFNREFMKHYYEVIMSGKILEYFKRFYPKLYSKHFCKDAENFEGRLLEVDHYIRNAYYKDVKLREMLSDREITAELIERFRKITGVKSVNLMIDRFDWTHNSDARVQNILSGYFDLFDTAIITSDDQGARTVGGISYLEEKGYDVVQPCFGRNPGFIEEIARKRIALGQEFDGDTEPFPIDAVSEDTYRNLIARTDGNISLMLDAFIEAETLFHWDKNNFDANEGLQKACTLKLEHEKQFRKIAAPQVLHF